MNLLITGDRRWNNQDAIKRQLALYDKEQTIVYHFIETGASLLGKLLADNMGFATREIEDNIVGMDYVLVFHNYIKGSVQSQQVVKECQKRNIQYQIIKEDK